MQPIFNIFLTTMASCLFHHPTLMKNLSHAWISQIGFEPLLYLKSTSSELDKWASKHDGVASDFMCKINVHCVLFINIISLELFKGEPWKMKTNGAMPPNS